MTIPLFAKRISNIYINYLIHDWINLIILLYIYIYSKLHFDTRYLALIHLLQFQFHTSLHLAVQNCHQPHWHSHVMQKIVQIYCTLLDSLLFL